MNCSINSLKILLKISELNITIRYQKLIKNVMAIVESL